MKTSSKNSDSSYGRKSKMRFGNDGVTNRRISYVKFLSFVLLGLLIPTIGFYQRGPTLLSDRSSQTNNQSFTDQLDGTVNYVGLMPKAKKPLIYSKQYVLLDAKTAEIVIADSPDSALPIASTTKMTTALVALTKLPLDQVVTVSAKPPLVRGSKIGLKAGEKITVRSLIQGLLIASGNDAAFVLAENYAGIPGDYSKFVEAMNVFAKQNHLNRTKYGDPAGLDDAAGRSTPRELANVARLLLRNEFLASVVVTPELIITSADGLIEHPLKNTNRLILADSPYYLPNAVGIKTGFTLDAGHLLVAAYRWQDRELIGVVMNTTESTNTASAEEMSKLFRWADSSLVLKSY